MSRECGYIVAAVVLAGGTARAADHHVCDCGESADADCMAGDDAADGASPASAWRTYIKARTEFGSIPAGDAILFCDGGSFVVEGGSRWVNVGCTVGTPCTVGDYVPPWASGDEARPVLVSTGDHGLALEDGGDAEHEEGYVIRDLVLVCEGCDASSGNGFFLYNDIDDVVIENVQIEGFSIGVHLAGSNACSADPECDGKNSRLELRSSTITDCLTQGFLGAGDGTIIEGNRFEHNGTTAVFDHNIYMSGAQDETVGSRIVGNELYRSDLDVTGSCAGVSLVVHGAHRGLVIEGNLVREDPGLAGQGCWGIAVDGGYDEAESFTDVVIRGNTVLNVGNTAIGVSSCVGCIIENNVVVSEQDFGTLGIACPDRDRGAGDAEMTGVVVRNNSIFMSGPGGTGVRLGTEGAGHAIVSNAILYSGMGDWNCLDADLGASSYDVIDHNACHFPAADAEWEDGSGTSPDPLLAWSSASGFDTRSLLDDPGFSSPAGPDFDLSAASDASAIVDAGHPTLSSPIDIEGNARDTNPDIGAFEYGAAPPPDSVDEPPDATTDVPADPEPEVEDGGGRGGCGCKVAS